MATVSILNTSSNISGKTAVFAENPYTITGLLTFSRSPSAPFAVASGSAVVANLDADKLDGYEAVALAVLAEAETVSGIYTFSAARIVLPLLNQFGGTSLSFPAIRRAAAVLEFVLADESNYTSIAYRGSSNSSVVEETGLITPAQVTANQNDYNPTSLSIARVLGVNTDASRNITGLVAQTSGRRILLINNGGQNIVLTHQDAASSAANRFVCPGGVSFTLNASDAVELYYVTGSGWWVLGF